MNRRVRAANYSSDERTYLLSIINNKYKHIIENKKTDAVSSSQKNKAWEDIAQEFNSGLPGGVIRQPECLKKFYLNQKKDIKKKIADDKKLVYITGGGKKEKDYVAPEDDLLLSIVNEKSIYGLNNPFDGDRTETITIINDENDEPESNNNKLFHDPDDIYFLDDNANQQKVDNNVSQPECSSHCRSNSNSVNLATIVVNDESGYIQQDDNSGIGDIRHPKTLQGKRKHDWKKYTPADLQTPTSSKLVQDNNCRDDSITTPHEKRPPKASQKDENIRRRRPTIVKALTTNMVAERYNLLISKRLQIADYQTQKLQLELKHQHEEHKLKMEILTTELNIKKNTLETLDHNN